VSKALYRKYRSKSLDEVVGQNHVTDILARSLAQGRVAHAYLLTGPRGVGKTSIARILAHEINHLPYTDDATHLDIIEIDAASNNGVEDIRDLRDKVQVAPVSAAKKIYIIDEVHMLSKPAFNALLKTLEEPPEHVVFILATTDVDKLPATIISRTQHFGFRLIAPKEVTKHLRTIADAEKIRIDDEALELIALRGEGSFRDSISLLDQLASLADDKQGITKQLVEDSLGLASRELVDDILAAVQSHDVPAVVAKLDEFENSGLQSSVLASQLIQALRGKLTEQPYAISLLDELLDVQRSAQPSLKLLTVLCKAAEPKQTSKTAALSAPAPAVSATIAELERQATKKVPKIATPPAPVKQAEATPTSEITAEVITEESPAAPQKQPIAPTTELDWNELIEYTRTHFVAIYSVLSKCHHELEGDTLTLYTGNNFYKKKLDDPKYLQKLSESLEKLGAGDLTIVTIPTPPPPKDSQAAAVAAIMGGGEEVTL